MALSSEEAEQYDRQIRLWGLEAQKRLVSFKKLLLFCYNLLLRAALQQASFLECTDYWNEGPGCRSGQGCRVSRRQRIDCIGL